MWLIKRCPLCNQISKINLTEKETIKYLDYQNEAEAIQNLFPKHSLSVREFLKSGYCRNCQENMFGIKSTKRIRKARYIE